VWYGLFASAGTPPLVAQRLNSAIERLLKMPDVREKMINMGFEPYRGTSEEFGKLIIQDLTRWTKIVELSGAKAD
jgi:tripartite-type tricarboxylate transporter receptor subunit TctC